MQKPCVSVIMNCHNSAKYLTEAIQSVYAQTFTSWEIIFWDNASTDNSATIAKSFLGNNNSQSNPESSSQSNPENNEKLSGGKLRYFYNQKLTTLGEARNLAIAKAWGEFVAFLDCDDLWLPEKLEKQIALFKANPNLALVTTNTLHFTDRAELKKTFDLAVPKRGMVFADLILNGWIAMSSAMLRKSSLDSLEEWFDPSLNVAEEADLFYRLAHDFEFDYVNEVLTKWRVHEANTTFNKFEQFAAEMEIILNKHKRLYPDYSEKHKDLIKLLSKRITLQKAIGLWKNGQGKKAREEIVPYLNSGKIQLFYMVSYLPGSLFKLIARLYMGLPRGLRRN